LTVKHGVRTLLARGGGSIICTGSPTGLNGGGADFTAYSSTKGGIHSMVRATAKAYAAEGIRVNTVAPGYTETSLVTTIADDPARGRRSWGAPRSVVRELRRTSPGSWSTSPVMRRPSRQGRSSGWMAV